MGCNFLQCLVERSLLGWKEFELEVMRDLADNVVIICSIENVDPMGVHTGDSITIAPAQTLTDKEYQRIRDAAVAIIREMGVECGGSNVQMTINPADGEVGLLPTNGVTMRYLFVPNLKNTTVKQTCKPLCDFKIIDAILPCTAPNA